MADNLGVRVRSLPALLLRHPANVEIVRYLQEQSPSAHGDLTSEMVLAAQGLRDLHSFAPDPSEYSYELLHTHDGVIFSVAVGQSTLLVRIPPHRRSPMIKAHGTAFPSLGPQWIALPAFQADIPLDEWRKTLRSIMKSAFQSKV